MINYAHRGASEYAPENTLSSFYLGMLQGANGIETDVQKTKDGALVLFHDDTLDRVSDSSGRLCEYTLAQLKDIKIYGNSTTRFYDRIITLREFLEKESISL
jgi:glycerophosphoryl diester phosphodiesterase